MNSFDDQSEKELVREATDLVRLIGEHVALKPSGREHLGVCPFHDDHSPSFRVVTHKGHGFYKCFACGASGDCFRFVMEFHKMDFGEALRFLADRAGVTLRPRRTGRPTGDSSSPSDLRSIVGSAAEFFQRNLQHPVHGRTAREVIERRGISDEMVEHFMLGAAPDSFDAVRSRLASDSARTKAALDVGLLKRRTSGEGCYDAFRNRLIFPICNDVGRPIAFGGRIINPDDTPKYLNSAESAIFHKSRTLYGLHLARRAIIESGHAVICEGYTDVIACHQAGITNVVGTLGTSLTRDHARILSRLCDTVVVIFDGDEAGQKAADRAVEIFFAEPVDVRISVLPDGLDPDDLLRQELGADRFREAIASATDALAFKLSRFTARLAGSDGLSSRQKRLEAFLDELADLGFGSLGGVRKRLVLASLSDLLQIPVADVDRAIPHRRPRAPLAGPGSDAAEAPAPAASETLLADHAPVEVPRALRLAEQELLALLMFEPAAAGQRLRESGFQMSAAAFEDATCRRIAEALFALLEEADEVSLARVLDRLVDDAAQAMASALFFEGRQRCEGDESRASEELAAALRTMQEYRQRHEYRRGGPPPKNIDDIASVAERIRQRQNLANLPGAIPGHVRS